MIEVIIVARTITMRAVLRFQRFIDCLKPLQCVISTRSIIGKRAFIVTCGSTMYIDVRNVHGHLDASSSNESRSLYSSEASINNVPVVQAFAHMQKNSSDPIIAVYWEANSKYNRFKKHPGGSIMKAEIEAVCLALKQAVFQMDLPRVRVVSNSKFVWKHFGKISLWWSLDEFLQQKSMKFGFCSTEIEDLYRLLHMIDVTIEYSASTEESVKRFFGNIMGKKVGDSESDVIPNKELRPDPSLPKTSLSKLRKKSTGLFLPEMSSAADSTNYTSKHLPNDAVPVVYTRGIVHIEGSNKKYIKAGYGVYWPHAQELGTGRRYSFYPVTLVRCQLQAIIDALQQAVDQNYRSIILRTDCVSFLVHHPRQWLKVNGSHVKYYDQYLRIVNLCKGIKVKFQPASDQVALSQAEALAENGVCLPIPSRRSKKKMYESKTSNTDMKLFEKKTPGKTRLPCDQVNRRETMKGRIHERMKIRNTNTEQQLKNCPMVVATSDATAQPSQNSSGENVGRELGHSKIEMYDKSSSAVRELPNKRNDRSISKGADHLKDLPSTSSSMTLSTSRDGEVSCEVSDVNANAPSIKENLSVVASEASPPTNSASYRRIEINEIMDEICSRIQCATLTYERLNRIKKYFAEFQIFTSHELDAYEWIINNMKTIYKDPINAYRKLRIVVGNRRVPINFAIKALQLFVENHTICMADMIKYFSYEGRNEITINELSQILKRLIQMNIMNTLDDDRSDHHTSQNSSYT
ncbi:unnamed protein product [Litomosoides sigmodontis]|uniref:Uncharacterized protein n=1 Tax=Litomosoides sigmodontis TaxID=42156 RepID=A0A3P6UPK1_LITSI|nr:unnamed protein product [Litomosoides sigmodontis]